MFDVDLMGDDPNSYLVGVEDKETGEMTLYEAGHAYALRQSVAGREELIEEHANEGMEWKERRDALVNQFGSKKKKAAIRCDHDLQEGYVSKGALCSIPATDPLGCRQYLGRSPSCEMEPRSSPPPKYNLEYCRYCAQKPCLVFLIL